MFKHQIFWAFWSKYMRILVDDKLISLRSQLASEKCYLLLDDHKPSFIHIHSMPYIMIKTLYIWMFPKIVDIIPKWMVYIFITFFFNGRFEGNTSPMFPLFLETPISTPWKINMEPTNHPSRKEHDLLNLHDYVPC